jgi:hypothetical protein
MDTSSLLDMHGWQAVAMCSSASFYFENGRSQPVLQLAHLSFFFPFLHGSNTSYSQISTKHFPNLFVRVSYRFGGKEGKHQRQKTQMCMDMDAYLVSIYPHNQLALLFFLFRRPTARLPSPSLLFRRRRRSRCKAPAAMT